MFCNREYLRHWGCIKHWSVLTKAVIYLVDCPIQLICTWIFICLCSMTKLKNTAGKSAIIYPIMIVPLSLPWYWFLSLHLLVADGTYYLSLNWRKLFPLKSDAPHFHSRIQVSWAQNLKFKKINYQKKFIFQHGRIFCINASYITWLHGQLAVRR